MLFRSEEPDRVPPELFAAWGRRDPIGLFEAWLSRRGITADALTAIEEDVTAEMDRAADEALESKHKTPEPEQALYEGFSEGSTLIGLRNRPITIHP